MKKITILIIIIIYSSLSAIDLNLPVSAIQNATSGLVLIYPSPASSAVNPALNFSGVETSATYLYGLKDLPCYNIHSGLRYNNFGFYLGNSFLDHSLSRENSSNAGFSYHYQDLSVGIGLRWLYNRVENYHEDSSIITDFGSKWTNGNIQTGFSIRNISQTSFLDMKLPVVYLWESTFQVSPESSFAVGFEKEDSFDFSFKFAARYNLFSTLTILTSYQYEPDRLGFGLVFNVLNMKVIYSFRTHQYLDLTHYISVGYAIKD
jgi:hypothetical protein